jgi:hypothetical protein
VTGRSDDPNDALEDELRGAVASHDEVPPEVSEQARRAADGRAPGDSCFVELVYDSVLDASLGDFMPEESVRVMSFAGNGMRLDLRLERRDSNTTLVGWTAPLRVEAVAAEQRDGSVIALGAEPDGTFRAADITHGPIRLRFVVQQRAGAPRRFHTSWFTC